jgi:hypothetical protein
MSTNATLPTDSAAYFKAEKALNAFYLEHELWRKPNRPLSDVEGVRSIADQCPLSFGPVVYAARTVYLLAGYHWSSDWDDDARICSEEEERGLTVSQMSEIVWSAVPNPANNRVSLLSGRVLTQPAEIRCYNVTGQLVQTLALPAGSQQIELQVAQWPAGLYFFMVVGTRQETVAGKFSIQH